MADLRDRAAARLSAFAQSRDKARVIHRVPAKPALAELMPGAEALNLRENVVHMNDMRRIYPSCQVSDGYIRKLCRAYPSWDRVGMAFDLERIKAVLAEATAADGAFTQRNLSAGAGLQRDTVGDIIRGRNKNPTINVLTSLAEAMGRDLSIFGIAPGDQPKTDAGLTRQALEQALDDAWAGRPRQRAAQVRYFAETVLSVLELPESQPSTQDEPKNDETADAEGDAPSRAATKTA